MRSAFKTKNCLVLSCLFVLLNATAQNQPRAINLDKYFDSLEASFIGKTFPGFSAKNLDKLPIESKDLQGKVVFVNFWYATCAPCIREIKGLNQLYERIKNEPDIVFLSFTYEPTDKALAAIQQFGIKFPVMPVTKDECYRLNLKSGFPTNFVVDKTGIIKWVSSGAPIGDEKASEQIFKNGLLKIKEQL